MTEAIIWDPIERLIGGFALAFAFLVGAFYLNKGRKREEFSERITLYGFGSLILGYTCAKLFTYLTDFLINGIYKDYIFYGDYSNPISVELLELFTKLAFISLGLGFTLFFLSFELIVKRTKYLLTIIYITAVVFIIFSPYDLATTIATIFFGTLSMWIIVFVFYLQVKWASLEYKNIPAFLSFGYGFLNFGFQLSWHFGKQFNINPVILSPVIYLIGIILVIIPSIVDSKYFSRSIFIWILGAIPTFILNFFTLPSSLLIYGFEIIIVTIAFLCYALALLILILINIRSEMISISEKTGKLMKPDILGVFTKPQRITEEEVSISKEKKICLVCKGKVLGITFICPKCETFYCEKCSKALIDLENACWACNAPIDKSKPSKPYKEEEEEITVEEKTSKDETQEF